MKKYRSLDATSNPENEKGVDIPIEDSWEYGWTHYGMTGQTKARMNKLTREVEIKERSKWIKCCSGCDELFTSPRGSKNATFFC